MAKKQTQGTSSSDSEENLLYVVLHGLISLVDIGKKGYTAFLLEMGEEHRYLYGNWLMEDAIPPRRLDSTPERGENQKPLEARLMGVEHTPLNVSASRLNPRFNALLKVPNIPTFADPKVRAVFHLPRPRNIYYFVCGKVDENSFSVDPSEFVNSQPPELIAAIRIFEYKVLLDSDDNPMAKLVSGDRSPLWVCPPLAAVKKTLANIAVLHIYDEPGLTSTDPNEHNLREFKRSMDFLSKNGTLTVPPPHIVPHPKNQPPIHGFLTGELNPLDEREFRVLTLLAQGRRGKTSAESIGTGGQVCSGGNGQR